MLGGRKKVTVKKKGDRAKLDKKWENVTEKLGRYAEGWTKPAKIADLKITLGELKSIAKEKNKREIEITDLANKRREEHDKLKRVLGDKAPLLKKYKFYPSNMKELQEIEKGLKKEVGNLKSQVYMIDFRKEQEMHQRIKKQEREKKFSKKVSEARKNFEKFESELKRRVPGFIPPYEALKMKPAEQIKSYKRMTKLYKEMLKEAKRVGSKRFWVKYYSKQPLTRTQKARQEQIQNDLLNEVGTKEKTLDAYKKGLSDKLSSEIVKRKGKEYGVKGLTWAKVFEKLPFSVRVEVLRDALSTYDKKISELRGAREKKMEKELEITGEIIKAKEKEIEKAEQRKIKKRKEEGAEIRAGGKELLKKEKLEWLKREKKEEGLALKNIKKGISEAEIKEKNEKLKEKGQKIINILTTRSARERIRAKDIENYKKEVEKLKEEAKYTEIPSNWVEWHDETVNKIDKAVKTGVPLLGPATIPLPVTRTKEIEEIGRYAKGLRMEGAVNLTQGSKEMEEIGDYIKRGFKEKPKRKKRRKLRVLKGRSKKLEEEGGAEVPKPFLRKRLKKGKEIKKELREVQVPIIKGEKMNKVLNYLTESRTVGERLIAKRMAKKPTRTEMLDFQKRYANTIDAILKAKGNKATLGKNLGLEKELIELREEFSRKGGTMEIPEAREAVKKFNKVKTKLVETRKGFRAGPIDEYVRLYSNAASGFMATPKVTQFKYQMDRDKKLGNEARDLFYKLKATFPETTSKRVPARGTFRTQKEAMFAVKKFMKKLGTPSKKPKA